MKSIYLLSGVALISFCCSCAKPVANFMVKQDSSQVPAEITFIDQSDADEIEWMIDNKTMTDSITTHRFTKSGKHKISLVAKKGKKSKTMTKEIVLDPPKECLVELTTSFGRMLIQLYDETPKHRDNFVKLVEENFYDGTLFHRVIDGFMIQGGDPNSKTAPSSATLGTGGPGYLIDAEFDERLAHVKGALAAARTGGPMNPKKRSSGSQFYIAQGKPVTAAELERFEQMKGITYTEEAKKAYIEQGGVPFLDQDYTVFGRVLEGFDVIDKIAKVEKDQRDRPKEDVSMELIIIK